MLPGPSLKVSAFVELMKRLLPQKDQLTNEQVRFVQTSIQRFEHEVEGVVKTKHHLPEPKKNKKHGASPITASAHLPTSKSKEFLEQLVKLPNENDALVSLQRLSDAEAERLAQEQGLRANSPDIARAKLVETVVTLRDIERIAGAGTKTERKS